MLSRLAGVLLVLSVIAPAQSFNYADFSSLAGLTLNGNAVQQTIRMRVTPAAAMQKGSFFRNQMATVANGFDTTFTFRISQTSGGGADGFAFVVHNDPRGATALGGDGGQMGYGAQPTAPANTAIVNALVIEFDTYLNSNGLPSGDLSGNELSIHTNGMLGCTADELQSIGRTTASINFKDGMLHTVRILYVPGSITVWFDNQATPDLVASFDFASGGTYVVNGTPASPPMLAAGGMAFVGMSAGCGALYETHDIGSWSFTPLQPAVWPGNATDFDCQVAINGLPSPSSTGVIPAAAGDFVALKFVSPGGATINQPFSAFYQVFITGAALSSAVIPGETPPGGFWLDVAGTNPGSLTGIVPYIDGLGLGGPTFLAPVLLPGGYSYGFVLPTLLGGTGSSLFLQAIITDPGLNGLNLGIGDAIELQIS